MEIAILKYKTLLLDSVKNSTIYNVSSRIYYQYFTFKGQGYTRNIVFSLISLQVFFQRNIFRKLRITVITSSRWNILLLFELFEEMCDVDLWSSWFLGVTQKNYAFQFTVFYVSFVLSLTIKLDITLHKRATVHVWFIEPWRINGISFPIWRNSFTFCIFRSKYSLTVVVTAVLSFSSSFVNC